jgi:hypothetical protein
LPANTKFEISQEGAALTLIVTNPAAVAGVHEINFGGWAGSRTVALSTNAPWTFATGAGYSDVVASAKIAGTDLVAGVTQSEGHTPDLPTLTPTITFTPITTQSSGTTVVTFTTVAPGMTDVSETVTFKRDMSTYMFSADWTTLTLFANFPRGTDLAGLNNTNIPELQDNNWRVTTLVMLGDKTVITEDQVAGIKSLVNTSNFDNSVLQSLANISLPDFDGTIPARAFEWAWWLKSANLPKVTRLEQSAFEFTGLNSIYAPLVESLGKYALRRCPLTTVYFPSVTDIEEMALNFCTDLTEVSFPIAISAGRHAFSQCPDLTDVSLPYLTKVEEDMFMDCTSLIEVSLPSATSVKDLAFDGCTSLRVVDLPSAHTFGSSVFRECSSTLTLKINAPIQPVTFKQGTFYGVGEIAGGSGAGTTTTQMTLCLGDNVTDESGASRPDNLPQDNVQWGGYYDNHTWVPFTWGRIEKYEAQTPTP